MPMDWLSSDHVVIPIEASCKNRGICVFCAFVGATAIYLESACSQIRLAVERTGPEFSCR
jgi:hypothetical protein